MVYLQLQQDNEERQSSTLRTLCHNGWLNTWPLCNYITASFMRDIYNHSFGRRYNIAIIMCAHVYWQYYQCIIYCFISWQYVLSKVCVHVFVCVFVCVWMCVYAHVYAYVFLCACECMYCITLNNSQSCINAWSCLVAKGNIIITI